jgi:hypothetical protein
MILKIFSPKKIAKNWRFLTQTKAKLWKKNLIITMVFEENANFFAENWQKSPKIVIITSTPDCHSLQMIFFFALQSIQLFNPCRRN